MRQGKTGYEGDVFYGAETSLRGAVGGSEEGVGGGRIGGDGVEADYCAGVGVSEVISRSNFVTTPLSFQRLTCCSRHGASPS